MGVLTQAVTTPIFIMRIIKLLGILAAAAGVASAQPTAEETVKHVLGTTTYVGSYAGTVLPIGAAGGTVTSFSATGGGALFSMGVANATSTPALTVTISNVAPDTIYGNPSGSTNPPSFSTVSTFLDAVFGATQGTVIYRGATGWAGLAPGTSGQYFETLGSGANPQWNTPSGSGNVITSGTITSGYLAVWNGATSVVADQYLPSGNFPAMTGDTTSSAGSLATTTVKVNGVSYGTSPSTNTVAVVTGSNATTYEVVPVAAGGTASATVAAANQAMTPAPVALGNLTGSVAINWASGNTFYGTLTGNTTFTFSNAASGQTITVRVYQTGTNSYTVTWPTASWAANTAPTMTVGKAAHDTTTFQYVNSTYDGSSVQAMQP